MINLRIPLALLATSTLLLGAGNPSQEGGSSMHPGERDLYRYLLFSQGGIDGMQLLSHHDAVFATVSSRFGFVAGNPGPVNRTTLLVPIAAGIGEIYGSETETAVTVVLVGLIPSAEGFREAVQEANACGRPNVWLATDGAVVQVVETSSRQAADRSAIAAAVEASLQATRLQDVCPSANWSDSA